MDISGFISDPFGLHMEHLGTCQMMARAVVVFFLGMASVRVSGLRTLGRLTIFDQLTILIIGSVLGRSIVSGQAFFGELGAVFIVVLLQRVVAWLTFKSKAIGKFFKGTPITLIDNGEKIDAAMRKTLVTEEDLKEELRLSANSDDLNTVLKSFLERSGKISFLKKT